MISSYSTEIRVSSDLAALDAPTGLGFLRAPAEMAQQLSSKHHALIQALLSRGPLGEEEFHAVFSGVTGKNPVTHQQLFNDFLLKINKELAYVQFELRGCRNQYDGRVFYGVVNNVADDQSKLGTKYSVPQIAFYKAVAEAIIQDVTNQGFITNIEALNIRLENQVQTGQGSQDGQSRVPSAFKSFSISQKERTLNDLIQDQWLCYTSNGKIGLGVRSFLDLRRWFHNNDIPSCDVCNEAGVKAYTCPNEGCTVRMHEYCLKRFSQRKLARVCPRCGTLWPRAEGDGEEEANVPERSRVPSSDPAPRTRSCRAEAVDEVSSNDPAPRKRTESFRAEAVDKVSSNDPAPPKRARICKAEAVEAAASNNHAPRKRTRSCKAETEDAAPAQAQTQTEAPWGNVPKRMRSCKTEEVDAAEAGPSQSTMHSQRRNH